MSDEKNDLDDLTRDIRKVIDANRKFLEHVMDEDFEADETSEDEEQEVFEEL